MRRQMIVSTISALLLVSALLCVTDKTDAQDQTGSVPPGASQPAKPDEPDCCKTLREKLAKLQQEVTNLENNVKKLERELKADDVRLELQVTKFRIDVKTLETELKANDVQLEQKHAQDVKKLTKSVLKNQAVVDQNVQRIGSNSNTIAANEKSIRSNGIKLRDIVRYDAESGRYVPDLLGNMQRSKSFRQEVQKTVEGKLWIYNNYPYEQIIHINGARWRARIGKSYVFVPLGHVAVTHITGAMPKYRDDWKFDEKEQQWTLVFDFDKPWR